MDNESYTALGREIEAEYQACAADPLRNQNRLVEAIKAYIKPVVRQIIQGVGGDDSEVEDVCHDVLMEVLWNTLRVFEKREAQFATYCWKVAKNKAINWSRSPVRRWSELRPEMVENDYYNQSSPEQQFFRKKSLERQKQLVQQYLYLLSVQDDKPYRTVANCFSLVLFPLNFPGMKKLSSPQWAYDELGDERVEQGAQIFAEEIKEFLPEVSFDWGSEVLERMEEKEEEQFVRDIIFGERFKVKDFENWSLRFRKKMREQIFEYMEEIEF